MSLRTEPPIVIPAKEGVLDSRFRGNDLIESSQARQARNGAGEPPESGSMTFLVGALIFLLFLSFASPVIGETGLVYRVEIEGISDLAVLGEMRSLSDCLSLNDRPPASIGLLQRRVDRDISSFLQFLKSYGYYGAKVSADVDTSVSPALVRFQVQTGPPYLLHGLEMKCVSGEMPEGLQFPTGPEIGLPLEVPVRTSAVLDGQKEILRRLGARGFPFAKVSDRRLELDHASHTAMLSFVIDPGPVARFGPVELAGLHTVDEALVRKKIPWKEGDRYNGDLLEEAQNGLASLGLFSTVRIHPAPGLSEKGELPMTIALTERKHRSVGIGAGYRTDEGPGVKLSWEHRNVFQRGERLSILTEVAEFTQSGEGVFRKPYFLRDDQALLISTRLGEDKPDAYSSRSLRTSGVIDREVSKEMKIGGGLAFKASRVTQLDQQKDFNYLTLPFHFSYDTSDNLLDPTRGGRLAFHFIPYEDPFGDDPGFVKGYVNYGHYFQPLSKPLVVLAGRSTIGVMGGAERTEIPADERFYAGGGGSIRGYAYQSVGPTRGPVPLGGKSLAELSFEARLRVHEDFGLVAFLDGGRAFTGTSYDPAQPLLWGTGMGFRYFTPIGPVRFDIGVPLERREGIDDAYHIYVSLGQAF